MGTEGRRGDSSINQFVHKKDIRVLHESKGMEDEDRDDRYKSGVRALQVSYLINGEIVSSGDEVRRGKEWHGGSSLSVLAVAR